MTRNYSSGGLSWYHSGHGGYYSTKGWATAEEAEAKATALERRFNFDSATFQWDKLEDGKYHLISSFEMLGRMQGKGVGHGPT